MPITLNCRCGRSFQARDDQVGKSAFCPNCGAKHFVPTPDAIVAGPNSGQQAQPKTQTPAQRSTSTTQKMFRCSSCGCKFLPSQVYDDNGTIICHGCYGNDDDDEDYDEDVETGLEIRAKFFPLAWLTILVPLELRINGKRYAVSWYQTKFIPLPPGKYVVKMSTNGLFGEMGVQSRRVNLRDCVKVVDYYYGSWWWSSMTVWEK